MKTINYEEFERKLMVQIDNPNLTNYLILNNKLLKQNSTISSISDSW